jgi:hypothetical protein
MQLKNLTHIALVTLSLGIILLGRSSLAGPGDSGGGGSTIRCRKQTHPYLLDRLSLNPGLADLNEVVTTEAVKPSISPERQAEISSTFPSDEAAFELAIKKLRDMENILPQKERSSKALMEILVKTIQAMSYKRTTHQFNVISRYELSSSLKSKCTAIQTAILYLPHYGGIISSPVWDSLDLETQAGLIVHEALRQVQGLYLLYDLTDEQLQMITALIMDGKSSSDLSFSRWMSPKLARLAFVTAGANENCANCQTQAQQSQDPVGQLMAKLAVQAVSDSTTVLDKNQRIRSESLDTPETLKELLDKLLKDGILKK